jgi:hypothetical protein
LQSDLPAKEFEYFRRRPYDEYRSKVFDWIASGKLHDIQNWLDKINDFNSFEEYDNHLRILIAIGRYHAQQTSPMGLNYRQIVELIEFPNRGNKIDNKLFDSNDEYLGFVRRIFNYAVYPYLFESSLVTAIRASNWDFILPQKELEKWVMHYFRKYCERPYSIERTFFTLYYNCITRETIRSSENDYFPEAKELFVQYFKSNLRIDQIGIYVSNAIPDNSKFCIDLNFIKRIFKDTWKGFENYMYDENEFDKEYSLYQEYFSEFMNFYYKLQRNSYRPVEFNFKYLKPGAL